MPVNQCHTPFCRGFAAGVSLPINFFLKIFFPKILLGWLILRFGGVFSVVFNKIG
nr:MAG TPA: hypothetical protein [Caudoviricetes sp.]